jgi:hypothetical protein
VETANTIAKAIKDNCIFIGINYYPANKYKKNLIVSKTFEFII